MNWGHGRIVQQLVAKESKQDQEHVLMMPQTLASHLLSKEVAKFNHAVSDIQGQKQSKYAPLQLY